MNLNNMNQKKPKHSLPFFSGSSSKGKKKSMDDKPAKSFGKKSSTRAGNDSGDREYPRKASGTGAFQDKERTERNTGGGKRFDSRQKFSGSKRELPKQESGFRPRSASASDKPFKRRSEEGEREFKKRPSGGSGNSFSGNRPNRRNDFEDRIDAEKGRSSFSGNAKREFRNKPDSNARPTRPRKFDDDSSPETTGRTAPSRSNSYKPDSNARPARPRKFEDDFSPASTGRFTRSRTNPSKPGSNARPARQRKFEDDFSPANTGRTYRSRTQPSRPFAGESKWDKDRKSDRPANDYQKEERVKRPRKRSVEAPVKAASEEIRLNKYISNSGVCSRREADTLIISGVVTVNGTIITELGHKIKPHDIVHCGGDLITNEKKVYLLLNKPKDYITTVTDPGKRKTVMELVADACRERIYPVGRLDRNTTGLLLFTNDGDLAKKLTHPRYGIEKIYHVELSMPLAKMDLDAIRKGINLDDGPVEVDEINYVEFASSKKEVGIKLHSGKNRVVRRIFESLGYKVLKLDRVVFAGLTKKDLARGRWRFLSGAEVSKLYALA
jgi:23S rRNA pseudouridine2605 synthase